MISVICESFACTPDVAVEQDFPLCRRILDYRAIEAAKAQHNQDAAQMTPEQTAFWMECMAALNED